MQVVATAGHVDHGKSSLVRALTGMEPDRLAEERRRGLTLDLGFAWTSLDLPPAPGGRGTRTEAVAFVDVPGHERFVPTMLAGIGPVPVVLLVVAADGGWMPQSSEHLDALDALGVRSGLLVVTRTDLADAATTAATTAQARDHLAGTALAGIAAVAVSARTGEGLPRLRAELARVLAAVPAPDPAVPVRLWVDRAFTVRGAGTVVTGTLPAGRLRVGDELALPGGGRVRVRGLQQLGLSVAEATGLSRVAVNLRGLDVAGVARGDALTTPGSAVLTAEVDVRRRPLRGPGAGASPGGDLPGQLLLHVGSAAVPVRVRPLGHDGARLQLGTPLPLRIGDTGLLRDPGAHRVVAGITVLDPAPPPLRRRGAARARAEVLATVDGVPGAAGELARRGLARRLDLVALGVTAADVEAAAARPGVVGDGDWLVDPAQAQRLRARLVALVEAAARDRPLEPGLPVEAARQHLALPTPGLVTALVAAETLQVVAGRVRPARGDDTVADLPLPVVSAVRAVLADLLASPYAAPEAHRLRELGLGSRELAAAVRAGLLTRVADGVYLAPGAVEAAARPLAGLPQPFTLSQARQAWATSRRVAVPLLGLLDHRGATSRQPDARRTVTGHPRSAAAAPNG